MSARVNTALVGIPWKHMWDPKRVTHMGTSLTPDLKNSLAETPGTGCSDTSGLWSAGWLDRDCLVKELSGELGVKDAATWPLSEPTELGLSVPLPVWGENTGGKLCARCTWLPNRWLRHPWVTQYAWIPAPWALLPEGTMIDLSTHWRFCCRLV